MAIQAKRIDPDGNVTTIDLDDNPSDMQIVEALGGTDDGDLLYRGTVDGWEVHALFTDMNGDFLIIGEAPDSEENYLGRASCNLTDDQVRDIRDQA